MMILGDNTLYTKYPRFQSEYPEAIPLNLPYLKAFGEYLIIIMVGRLYRDEITGEKTGKPYPSAIRVKLRRFTEQWERINHTSIPEVFKRSMCPVYELISPCNAATYYWL
jgi:hypothetical protein